MKREMLFACVVAGACVLSSGTARSQEIAVSPFPPPLLMLQGGPEEGGPPDIVGERIELLGFGGLHGGKVVKGAPFSATATTTQTLADGKTHINRTSNVYRDSQGRVSREVTLPGGAHSFVVISDPVAGKQYLLRPDEKVAYEMPGHGMKGGPGPGAFERGGAGGPGNHQRNGNGGPDVQKTSLGTQTNFNGLGVSAEGTRYTRTIPAGQIGNDQPIVSVSESWYSPELQTVVMRTHSDPRFGSFTYALSNVQRQEQPSEKFAVPSDYTVKQGGPRGMRRFRGGPPAADSSTPPPPNN